MTQRGEQQREDPSRRGLSVDVGRAASLIGGAFEWTKLQILKWKQRRDEKWLADLRRATEERKRKYDEAGEG